MDNLKGLFSLYGLYGKMDLRWAIQDPGTFAMVVASETIGNIASILGVMLLALRFGGVGGLTTDEILFMLGFFQMADGLTFMLFGSLNVMHISRRVGRGQLDHMLIQPRPLWMQLMAEGFMPVSGSYGLLTGIILTCIACARLQLTVSIPWLFLLLIYILCHAALSVGQMYLYGAAAFYRPVACEEISSVICDLNTQLGKFPLAGLPPWMTMILTTLLPVGLAAYIPSLILLHKFQKGPILALPLAVAAAFLIAASYAFRKGLHYYAKVSCNRYKDMGFRN
ncbi:MAG: ABC-2 family transporter protein [Eubacteriales bacterium]|nr:ABC-2 family transporter protein [Eubacteriales bacterium]